MNGRNVFAVLFIVAFLLLFYIILAPTPGGWPEKVPVTAGAGTALWMDRTFEVVLQGFIILAGVVSILLLLVYRKRKEESA
ncbi:MAG: hypothetical protein A4E35_01408 [Methanoregula sp. PtaU1.Bin051]|nr:MAG: hypothetical protein A4E35_01408 [Methanoregula sp. PtaU1.Bin051]